MRFPRYWAKAGRDKLAAWGWSDESAPAAEQAARETLARIAEKVARGGFAALGRYGYGERPLREPVLETLPGAAVTRNGYGCEVLNTERAMFIDIDLVEPKAPGFVARLLGRALPDVQSEALSKIESWLARNPDWGFRAYRTKSGLRLLATHAPVPPADGERVMVALGADPLYLRLCRAQQSYRARLTPKPWRCGFRAPGTEWPFANPGEESTFRKWQEEYARKQRAYAACRFLRAMGNAAVAPEIRPLVALHDERTRSSSQLPLA